MKDGNLAIAVRAGATAEEEASEAEEEALEAEEEAPEADAAANDERAPRLAETVSDRRAAIKELMRAHGDAIFGYCVRMVGKYSLAHDTTQLVFLQAHRDLDRFTGETTLRKWLFGIAKNRCLDAIKTERRQLERFEINEPAVVGSVDPGMGPFEHVDRAQSYAALEACLQGLPPESRATVLLRYQTGCTYEEMTEMLGATVAALEKRVARALPRLRQCMEEKGWSGE